MPQSRSVSYQQFRQSIMDRGRLVFGDGDERDRMEGGVMQWSEISEGTFVLCHHTRAVLPPGFYNLQADMEGTIRFRKETVRTRDLMRFPDTQIDRVVAEIERFWELEPEFNRLGFAHKRGILLYGEPGCGKSCLIQLVVENVIQLGGIGLQFSHPELVSHAIDDFRKVHPHTPIVVVMEDIDETIREHSEKDILNLLDGIASTSCVVFLATTNHPETLDATIVNRPSRFDKRIRIGPPSADSRRMYLQSAANDRVDSEQIDRWVTDTDGFSFAHLQELVVCVAIMDNDYDDVLTEIRSMSVEIDPVMNLNRKAKAIGFTGVEVGGEEEVAARRGR